jgi:glycosyltransferase involved in cell wall biosynthesis
MQVLLRMSRAYCYTGTQPASYTLGLIEAMMTGIPVVSIGPKWMNVFPYGPDLFEGHEIAGLSADDPTEARAMLTSVLQRETVAAAYGEKARRRAIELFGIDTIREQWREFLS